MRLKHSKKSPLNHLIYFMLFFLKTLMWADSVVSKVSNLVVRDEASDVCGPDIYCLPKANDTWTMGETGTLRWYQKYTTFLVQGNVDVRLFEMSDVRNPVLEWLNIPNSEGYLTVNLNNSKIFPPVPNRQLNTAAERKYQYVVVAHGYDIVGQQRSPIFKIIDPPSTDVVAPASASGSNPGSPNPSSQVSLPDSPQGIPSTGHAESSNGKLSSGVIAGISTGCVIAGIVAAALFFVVRKRRETMKRKSLNEKPLMPTLAPFSDCYNHSTTTIGDGTQPSKHSICNMEEASRSSLRLTVKDAQMIADTYRRLLRKPSWNSSDLEELGAQNSYSDELLRRELEAEGCGVKQVSTGPAIVVTPEDEVLRKSMSADRDS